MACNKVYKCGSAPQSAGEGFHAKKNIMRLPRRGKGARAGTLASPHPAVAYSVRAELVEACSYGGQAKGFALWKPKRRLYRRQAAEASLPPLHTPAAARLP